MSKYVDEWGIQYDRATVFVHEDARSAKVTYRGQDGKRFRVMVHQKPNPVGFFARLPGDKKPGRRT